MTGEEEVLTPKPGEKKRARMTVERKRARVTVERKRARVTVEKGRTRMTGEEPGTDRGPWAAIGLAAGHTV